MKKTHKLSAMPIIIADKRQASIARYLLLLTDMSSVWPDTSDRSAGALLVDRRRSIGIPEKNASCYILINLERWKSASTFISKSFPVDLPGRDWYSRCWFAWHSFVRDIILHIREDREHNKQHPPPLTNVAEKSFSSLLSLSPFVFLVFSPTRLLYW